MSKRTESFERVSFFLEHKCPESDEHAGVDLAPWSRGGRYGRRQLPGALPRLRPQEERRLSRTDDTMSSNEAPLGGAFLLPRPTGGVRRRGAAGLRPGGASAARRQGGPRNRAQICAPLRLVRIAVDLP